MLKTLVILNLLDLIITIVAVEARLRWRNESHYGILPWRVSHSICFIQNLRNAARPVARI